MRILLISVLALFVVAVSLLSARFWGYSQVYFPYEHTFFKLEKPLIIVPWEQNFFLQKKPDLALLANVYRNNNQELLIAPSAENNPDRSLKSTPTRPTLTEFLKKFPQTRVVLNILDNQLGIHEQVAKAIEDSTHDNNILIQSDYNVLINSIKKLKPLLVYGSAVADIMRFKSFHSMGIISAGPFKGDVFYAPLKIKNLQAITPAIAEELKRRHKPIILGPVQNKEEISLALSLGAVGIVVDKPETAYP